MWLTIEVPSQAPLVVEVVGPKATIGSDPACDIVIADDEISPKHAELRELDDGRAEIEDLNSGAGTWVGGVRLGGPATLEGGERLRIGRTELISSLERPDPTERALTRRENLQRLVTQSRRATVLASAAVAIAVIAVVLAAAGVFSSAGNESVGLIVTSVVPGTPAADEGIQGGRSIVVGVDGEPVASFREYCDAVEGLNGQTVKFNLLEPDGPRVIDLEL